MPDTASRVIGPVHLTAAAATLYTVPGATTLIIRNIHVVNGHTLPVTLTLSIGADAAGTRLFDAFSINSKGVLEWTGFMPVAAAEIIQGFASVATQLVITVSGVLVT